MSIQNNTTQLRAEQTELQSLLDAVNALPEAAGGSGGSVETCTVTIRSSTVIDVIVATTVENGSLASSYYVYTAGNSIFEFSVENVLCGSTIYVSSPIAMPAYVLDGGVTRVYSGGTSHILQAPISAGAVASVYMYSNV